MKMWNICDVYIVRRLPPRIVQEEVFNFGKSILVTSKNRGIP